MALVDKEIWTIGHSTRSWDDFILLLRAYNIGTLVDVRHYPGSRKFPHYNKEALDKSLASANVRYEHIESLGGRRKPNPSSPNTAWRHEAFRGYADYMATSQFLHGLTMLEEIAMTTRTAYMCSEAVWWRCHRALISDMLKSKGWNVYHIMSASQTSEHPYTSPAKIVDGKLSYT